MADEDKKVASVQARIETPELLGSTNFWSQVISWGRQVDNTPAWGSTTRAVYLDDFWKADRMLPGVVYTMVSRVASLGWSITGPTEDLHYWHSMILDSDGGYSDLIRLLAKDYFCTDEGAVFEVGRDSYPDGPARQLWHMDARLCIPGPIKASILGANGTPKEVLCDLVFKDVDGYKCMVEGHFHRFCSLPATDQTRRRLGFCFLSRALRAAKLANFLTEYQEEELKDMPPEGIATASGITEAQVRLAIQQHESERQRKEQYTFPGILWIVGNALGQEVKLEWHPFRRLWEKFDERTAWEVFMKTLALDAGLDIAELWQIETTGATKAQVSIQHRKAMGKGPSEFLIDFERTINREILPVGYIFAFDQRDDEQDLLVENIRSMRIRNVRELWRPDPAAGEGLITRDQAMEMLAEEGVIPTRFVAPPEGRLTDITKEVSGLNTATIYHDGTIERHRSYWQLNGRWKEEKATEPFPFDESLHKDSKGGPGSGHHGHLGRPGRHGGSLPKGAVAAGAIPESHSSSYHDNPREDSVGAQDALGGWEGGDRRKVGEGALYMYNRAGAENLIVLRDAGESVGVASIAKYDSKNPFPDVQGTYIEASYVATKRSGYGRSLMNSVVRHAAKENKGVFLQAVPDAVGFYEAIGMKRSTNTTQKRIFYWSPEDVQGLSKSADDNEPENGVFVAGSTKAREKTEGLWPFPFEKGGPGSGHYGHEGRAGQLGRSAPGAVKRGVNQHVWERAGRRARYKLVRTAVRHLAENAVLPESKEQNWHLPMVFQGKVAGILVGNDARAVTVLGPTMEPYPGSELVQFGG